MYVTTSPNCPCQSIIDGLDYSKDVMVRSQDLINSVLSLFGMNSHSPTYMMSLSSETKRQHYSKELAAYTLIQFTAACASLPQDKATNNEPSIAHTINCRTKKASDAGGVLYSGILTHVLKISRRSDVKWL